MYIDSTQCLKPSTDIVPNILLSLENLKPSTAMFIDSTQYLIELGKPKTQYSHVYR